MTWILAARPKTLPAAVAPVAVGTALGALDHPVRWGAAVGALVGALLLQIGCNFVNDAADGQRGTDAGRLGPQRAVAAGLVTPRAMSLAAAATLLAAFAVGLWLTTMAGWPVLLLGVAAIAAAIAYTAGPYPAAYHGWGDPLCLLFFGPAAVLGAAWMQLATPDAPAWSLLARGDAWWVALACGLHATAILAINNVRDREGDARAGKRTLAVRLGRRGSRTYLALLLLGAAAAWGAAAFSHGGLWLASGLAGGAGVRLAVAVALEDGAALNRRLAQAALLELGCCTLAVLGLVLL